MRRFRDYENYIEEYKDLKYHKSYSFKEFDLYSYSSNTGKFGISNILLEILVSEFSPIECKLLLSIYSKVPRTESFEDSGVVRLVHSDYSTVCSRKVFSNALNKFLDKSILIDAKKPKTYILNTLYVNKFKKIKVNK